MKPSRVTTARKLPHTLGVAAAIAAGACGTTSGAGAQVSHAAAPPKAAHVAAPTPALSLPAPTGPYRVGTIALPVRDPSRGVDTMVQLFYPTLARDGRPAPYLPPKTTRLTASALHVPKTLVATIVTHVFSSAPPAPGAHPIVLFSPGLTELRSDATALAAELASRGYVVAAVDHPYESAFVELPGGRVIRGRFIDSPDPATTDKRRAAAVRARIGDIAAVLRALPGIDRRGLLADHLDLARLGMFGFSLGGATTDEAMHAFAEIKAGVDLDGSLYGRSLTAPLERPFLFLARDGHTNASDPSWRDGWAMLRGWRREIRLIGSGHGDFTDLAGLIQQLAPGTVDPTGYYGPITPARATAAARQVLVAFFDRFLLGDRAGDRLLNAPAGVNPLLARVR